MYTLRIIEETRENEKAPFEQVIENFDLGSAYSVFGPETKRFKEVIGEDVSMFFRRLVFADIEGRSFFIRKDSENHKTSYFIMTDSGKTFEKL